MKFYIGNIYHRTGFTTRKRGYILIVFRAKIFVNKRNKFTIGLPVSNRRARHQQFKRIKKIYKIEVSGQTESHVFYKIT